MFHILFNNAVNKFKKENYVNKGIMTIKDLYCCVGHNLTFEVVIK